MEVLRENEAASRFLALSSIRYSLHLRISESTDFSGEVLIFFTYSPVSVPIEPAGFLSSLFARKEETASTWLDFSGGTVESYAFEQLPPSSPRLKYSDGRIKLFDLVAGTYALRIAYRNAMSEDKNGLIRKVDASDSEIYVYSHFEPYGANHFCPCFDQPDLKATLALTVTAPAAWKVIGNSPAENQSTESQSTTHKFQSTPCISTYLWALCAGNFSEWSQSCPFTQHPLRLFCRKSLAEIFPAAKIFSWTISSFHFFVTYLSQSYDFAKYDQVFVPELPAGAMENVCCVTFNDSCICANPTMLEDIHFCNTVMHENAHVWFGNTVTMKWWGDVWLNESFATFLSAKAQLAEFPQMERTLIHAFLTFKEAAYDCDELPNPKAVKKQIETADCSGKAFDLVTYVKGSSVLEQLEFVIGECAFQRLLQTWLVTRKSLSVTFEDFESLLREQQPLLPPDWLQKWICHAGVNELEAVWQSRDGLITDLVIVQRSSQYTAPATLRSHCVVVSLLDAEGREDYATRVTVEPAAETSCAEFVGRKSPALVLLNSTEQGHCKVVLPPCVPPISKIAKSESRHCILRAMLHAVRDGKVPAPVFLETAATVLRREPEVGLCYFLVTACFVMLLAFLSPGNHRKALASLLFNSLLDRIRMETNTENKRELQSYLFRFLIHPCDIMQAVSWLDCPPSFLALDSSDRVEIIEHYAEISIGALALAESESKTNAKARTSFLEEYCRAAVPVPLLKDAAFREIHERAGGMQKEKLKATMKGFSQVNQHWLLPYALRMLQTFPNLLKPPLKAVAEDYIFHMAPMYMEPGAVLKRVSGLIWIVKTVSRRAADRCEELLHRLKLCEKCRQVSRSHPYDFLRN